jgi:type II secretory pathway component PulF
MTYAMWAILTGMAMMFIVSLYKYRQSLARAQETRWLSEHHVIDRLRAKLRS